MARDLGPAMIDNLEARRGLMSDGEYFSRRVELDDLIRRRKTIEYTRGEKAARLLLIPVGVVLGFALAGWLVESGNAAQPLALMAGVVVALAGVWSMRLVGRNPHR